MSLLTPPTLEPVTVDEARQAARVSDTSAFDAVIPNFIAAARQLAEQITGRCLMVQTHRIDLQDWPAPYDVLPIHQATAAAVSYWAGSSWVVVDPAAYEFDALDVGTGLAPKLYTSWPLLPTKAIGARVRIDLTAGATSPAAVPACVKRYILAMVSHWIETPSAATATRMEEAPFLRLLLDPAKVY